MEEKQKNIMLGSLFDGIGGFPLAAFRNGITPLWSSEIEAFPSAVTKIRFPQMMPLGDITKLDGGMIPVVDIITGGSPCQDLSVAGKRAGLTGERSSLFLEQTRIVKEMGANGYRRTDGTKRPRYMVWENVPGAFSSQEGEDFRTVLTEICRIKESTLSIPRPPGGVWTPAGCIMGQGFSIAWRVLDAQFWGVPQRRRRIFLIADFGGYSASQILFESDSVWRHFKEMCRQRQGTAGVIEKSIGRAGKGPLLFDNHGPDLRYKGPVSIAQTLTSALGTGGNNTPLAVEPSIYCIAGNSINRKENNGGNGKGFLKDICYTLTTSDRHCVLGKSILYQDVVGALCSGDEKGVGNQYVSQNKCIIGNNKYVRRLIPLECERLMGYPDRWTDISGATDGKKYKALGNSIAIPCADFIMCGIAYFLNGGKYEEE